MAITDPTTGQPYGDNVNPFESTKPIADPKLAEQMQKDYQTIFGNKPQNAPAPSGGVVNPGETVEQRNARLGFGGTPAPVSTPTPTPAPTDTQTQQPQTQMTDASNAEYQALQDQSQFFADKYTQLQSEFDNYTADIARIDSENHPMIQNIKDIFGRRIEEMNKTNTAMQGQVGLAGERTGLARYASQMQTGLISKETTAGMNRISELESQKLTAIQQAKDALKSKAKDRWKMFNEFMDSATTAYTNKVQAVKDLHTMLKDEEDRAQNQKLGDLQMQQIQMTIDEHKQGEIQKYSDALGSSLVTFDSDFNVIEASPEEVIEMALQMGIDPAVLYDSMSKKAAELRKESREERGSFFDRQKLAVEQAQNNFNNFIDTQRLNMESEKFGIDLQGMKLSNEKLRAELYGAGTDEASASWADLIVNGKAKLTDVPAEQRGSVATALSNLPPKPADIEKTQIKINELDSLLTNPGITKAVGTYGTSRINYNLLDWNDKSQKNNFIAKVEQLLSSKTLQTLIDAKAEGATFGALSEGELNILRASASTIGTWARDDDGDGKTDFYEVDEKSFKEEITKIRNEYQKLVDDTKASTAFQPFTNYQDFYQKATPDQKALYTKFDNDPAFKNASVKDLLDAVNQSQGFRGEKGSGDLLSFASQKSYPQGTVGGQCGTFAHKIVDFPPVGDLKTEKFASVNKFGIKKDDWKPQSGDVVITNEGQYGHVLVLGKKISPTQYQVIESNYKGDEKVSYSRIIDINSPEIYGAIRGTYKV